MIGTANASVDLGLPGKRPSGAVRVALGVVGVVLAAVLLWWLVSAGLPALLGDFAQVVVALGAAGTMATVGWLLTIDGDLAKAGLYEKLAVWAALSLSVVSAITTSTGLLKLLEANPSTGAMLTVLMALLLGLGIQVSMLIYALNIGDDVQRLAPVAAGREDDEDAREEAPRVRVRWILNLLVVVILVVVGLAMTAGLTLRDVTGRGFDALWLPEDRRGATQVVGLLMLLAALALAVALGVLRRPGTVGALVKNLGFYLVLLSFSSGFGYLSYFSAAQSDDVRAIDRDNVIETETGALVRRIRDAARLDVDDALIEARSGEDYRALAGNVDDLAGLFVANRDRLRGQIAAFEAERDRIIQQRRRLADRLQEAGTAVTAAKLALQQSETALRNEQASRDRQVAILTPDLRAAEQEIADARAGRDGTGIAECGPNCKRAERRRDGYRAEIERLERAVADAQGARDAAAAAVASAETELRTVEDAAGGNVDEPPPPTIVDRSSFQTPLIQYSVDPSRERLRKVADACQRGRNMLLGVEVAPSSLPRCDVALVDRHLVAHAEGQATLAQVEQQCTRQAAEQEAESVAKSTGTRSDLQSIPPYLVARLGWLDRCVTAANSGSPRMTALTREANKLESEYTSAGYDPRRVLRSLAERNGYAVFSLAMAVVVDVAILFAGFAVNGQRGRELREDRDAAPDRIAQRVYKALETVAGTGRPEDAALALARRWEPRTDIEVGSGDMTHKLRFADEDPDMREAMSLVLNAAGGKFARYVDAGGERSYLLHRNFVTLLNQLATSGTRSAGLVDLADRALVPARLPGGAGRSRFGSAPAIRRGPSPRREIESASAVAPRPTRIDTGEEMD